MAEHQEKAPTQKSKLDVQQSINTHADSAGSVQFEDNRPDTLSQLQTRANNSPQVNKTAQLQAMANQFTHQQFQPIQKKKNNTGLPDNLKSGIENLSGHYMDDVKVHYNSDKPAQLNAHAYAQGSEIHLGSGQEKHLPHEAWHVVQQKQGRVKPTMQMKGDPSAALRAGMNVNDDVSLEKEADVMGAKALQMKENHAMTPSVKISNEATIVQRIKIKASKAKRYGKSKAKDAIETKYMSKEERSGLLEELEAQGQNPKLREEIIGEWRRLDLETTIVDLDSLYAIGIELDAFQGNKEELDGKSRERLQEISLQLHSGLEKIRSEEPTDETSLFTQMILSYKNQLDTIDESFNEATEGIQGQDLDLTVNPAEIQGYREDMKRDRVWGGLAEASHIATNVLHFITGIYVVDNLGNLLLTRTIGAGGRKNNMDLVHLGNHYVVVVGAVQGAAYVPPAANMETEEDGNCLFEALQIIDTGQKMAANNRGFYIRWLRQAVTGDPNPSQQMIAAGAIPGMSDDVIETSIMEMILSNQRLGRGPNMTQSLESRKLASSSFENELSKVKTSDSERKKLKMKWDAFESAQKENQSSEKTLAAYDEFNNYMAVLPLQPDAPAIDSGGLINESQEVDEGSLREETKSENSSRINVSPHNDAQSIVIVKGHEYVIDRIGQLVVRHVIRNISDHNTLELASHKAIYPSNDSPVPGASDNQVASGTGSNKIKNDSDEMRHVQGHKPSNFLSATTTVAGALNPKGKPFTNKKGKASVQVSIDLAYIASTDIRALYTNAAIAYYLLHNFQSKKASKQGVVDIAVNSKKKSAGDLAKEHDMLSEKEWQALLDVIRTKEVLISGVTPKEAITKKS
jgi:hypothetical protein